MNRASSNGGKTGWPPGLLQDDHSRLSKWFASRPEARYLVRKNLMEINMYGCHNRKPYKSHLSVKDGYVFFQSGQNVAASSKIIAIPFKMSESCNYTKTELGRVDEKCNGCKWKEKS